MNYCKKIFIYYYTLLIGSLISAGKSELNFDLKLLAEITLTSLFTFTCAIPKHLITSSHIDLLCFIAVGYLLR